MLNNKLNELLEKKKVLMADGAIGTNLFQMGLESGDAPEFWNVDNVEKIKKLHKSFVDAGSDIILTNTFGANRSRLSLHKAEDRSYELNKAGAAIAKSVAVESSRDILVAGSIGPTGEMLFPLGTMTEDEASEIFLEQAKGLKDGGADIIWIETMSSLEELTAAVNAVVELDLPVVATMSFDTNAHTMMGVSPKAFSDYKDDTLGNNVFAIGCNCGVGSEETIEAIKAINKNIITVAKANCGVPEFKNGGIQYSGTVDTMAEYAKDSVKAGVAIVGGCCGTTAEHLVAMRKSIDEEIAKL